MTELAVRRHGTPGCPRLVLVHGLTESAGSWPDAVARWGDAWDVRAVDQRGHGDSPRFTDEQLRRTPDVLVADLLEVLADVGPAVVVGHSLGGIVALRAALARPDLVRALVLEDPAKPSGDWAPDPAFVAANQSHLDAVCDDRAGEVARMRQVSGWSDAEIDGWADAKPRVDRRLITEGLFLGDAAWESAFQRLTVPTLVVVPVGGAMAPDPGLIDNPLVRVVAVPGCGHQVRRDNPVGYHDVVDPFLARCRDGEVAGG